MKLRLILVLGGAAPGAAFGQAVGTDAAPGAAVKMEKVEVSASAESQYNSIDRKVYEVGKEIQATTGSARDLMQNIPSVQVDIDGNVSLRGSDSVLILIDGRPSTLMGASRSEVLDQLPADTIERIEVITAPSAKFKADGAAGIINIVLKKKGGPGYSGTVRLTVGNVRRFGASANGNYNTGKFNLFGSFSVRQDSRPRTADDERTHIDAGTGSLLGTRQYTVETSRPFSEIGQAGVDYKLSAENTVGAVLRYYHRMFKRTSVESDEELDASGHLTSLYDRFRVDPEFETDEELKTSLLHTFDKPGEQLTVELQGSNHVEQEDNHYTNVYSMPRLPTTYDNKRLDPHEKLDEQLAEFTCPLAGAGRMECGYSREEDGLNAVHVGTLGDPASGILAPDPTATNKFLFHQTVHSAYDTITLPSGRFGFEAGLRIEETYLDTDQVTSAQRASSSYFRLYPSFHLTYDLSDKSQFQLSYSRRVNRPQAEDLNPYPEYQDPFNVRAGNPDLRPEDIHSIESGYQYKDEGTSYLAALYYREVFHGFAAVTRYIDATTLLTTRENLAQNRSEGVEVAAERSFGDGLSLNASGEIYREQIDASNLGYLSEPTNLTWDGKLNINYRYSKSTYFQFNSNFTARRLTPQGYRLPTYVANIGVKHDLADKRTSLVFTLSDLLGSLRERTLVDTPTLHDLLTRRRSSRIFYVAVVYSFGGRAKKAKDDPMEFDTSSP